MKKIQLSGKYGKGKFTMVDDEDAARLEEMGVSLYLQKIGYVSFTHQGKMHYLHRFLTGASRGACVDHINHDKLDNTSRNLRICTSSQNSMNKKSSYGNSQYKGVSYHKRHKKYRVAIYVKKKNLHLGYFEDEKEAARAYNKAAKQYFGEFAFLNDVGLAE